MELGLKLIAVTNTAAACKHADVRNAGPNITLLRAKRGPRLGVQPQRVAQTNEVALVSGVMAAAFIRIRIA
jgi:hypothetical protein